MQAQDSTFSPQTQSYMGWRRQPIYDCVWGEKVESWETLSYRKSAGRSLRHTLINDLIKRALATVEIPSRLEPSYIASYLSRIVTAEIGRRTFRLISWNQGDACLVWDFTCLDIFEQSHLNNVKAVTGQLGAVASERWKLKMHYNYTIIQQLLKLRTCSYRNTTFFCGIGKQLY